MVGDPSDWQRAVMGIERAVNKLRVVPVSDLAAWRGAAQETAGVFAAWSRRFEGDTPGPLANSADALARSAQHRSGDPAPSRAGRRDFRGIATVVAQSGLNNDSPMAWAMLLDQLGRTMRAIRDAHAIRGEAKIAEALVGSLSVELEVLHDRFEMSSPRELVPEDQIFEERVAEWWPEGAGIALDIEDDLDLDLDHNVDFEL